MATDKKKKQAEINAFNNEIITNSVDYDVDPLIEKRINDFVNKQNKYTIPSLLQDETNDTTFKKRKIPYKCHYCGKVLNEPMASDKVKGFPKIYNSLYEGNDYKLPICMECLEKLYIYFFKQLNSMGDAIERICMLYDLYFDVELVAQAKKNCLPNEIMSAYLSKLELKKYAGYSYGNTLEKKVIEVKKTKPTVNGQHLIPEGLDAELVKFWGYGYEPEDYPLLQEKYEDWITKHECVSKSQELVFKTLSQLEVQIGRELQKGNDVTKLYRQLNEFLNAGNLQPKQTNDNKLTEQNTFGTLIKKWEMERPIAEPDPEWKDVDGIGKYISVWFLGHLCKMVGIRNKWSQLYEETIKQYTVEKSEYQSSVDELSFNDVFGGAMDD